MSILGNPILMGGNGGGGGANIQSLSVTQNGTYTASGAVDGYSPVVVSVAGGGSKNILSGVEDPTVDQGNNGDIYIKYTGSRAADIPAGATELSYIGLTGSQYINTGIPGNTADLRTELCYQPKSGYTSASTVFGAAWSESGYFLMLYNGKWRFHTHGVVTDDGTASTSDFTILYTSRSEFRVNQTVYSISGSGTDSSNNILLGYLSYQGSNYGRGNVQYMKMWSGETLIRDFVPVLDPNGVACLYDAVSGNYFYNQGTGNFTSAIAGTITAADLKVSGAWQNLIGSNIHDVDLGGGGGAEDASMYGDLFKYCLLSTDSTDQFNRDNRWFKRNSSEPIIVLGSAFFTSGSMAYTGYAVISFTGTAVTGTYSSYGDLSTPPEAAATPMGTAFYIQQMNGMYPPSSASNKLELQFGNNAQNVLEFVIDDTKLIHNAGTSTFTGDSDLLQAFYNFIDSVYQKYYA